MDSNSAQRRAAGADRSRRTTGPSSRRPGAGRASFSAAGLAGLLLASCVVGPAYERPSVATPAAYRDQGAAPSAASVADLPWWSVFKDAALKELIREAL